MGQHETFFFKILYLSFFKKSEKNDPSRSHEQISLLLESAMNSSVGMKKRITRASEFRSLE